MFFTPVNYNCENWVGNFFKLKRSSRDRLLSALPSPVKKKIGSAKFEESRVVVLQYFGSASFYSFCWIRVCHKIESDN